MMKTIAKNTINSVNSASSFEVMCFSYFDYKFIRTQSKEISVLLFYLDVRSIDLWIRKKWRG